MRVHRLRLLWGEVLGLERVERNGCPSTLLSVVTHVSDDRLHQLEGLCLALTDGDDRIVKSNSAASAVSTICVAVFVQNKTASTRVRHTIHALPGLDQLIVRVQCFTSRSPSKASWYPINQLRNRALAQAGTDLVLICDVDFRPCRRLARLLRASGEIESIFKRVSCRLNCVVLPAFEVSAARDDDDDGVSNEEVAQTAATEMPEKSWWLKTLACKQELLKQWEKGRVVPFASRVWARGHRATNFDRWKAATDLSGWYEVAYEEGFEPFVIMNRLLVPAFDERFEGYGRNKVIFFYGLHSLGFSFTVEHGLFLVHAPHERSESWRRTFDREAVAELSLPAKGHHSERFAAILEQYKVAKGEINAEASQRRHPPRGGGTKRRFSLGLKKSQLGRWPVGAGPKLGKCSVGVTRTAFTDALRDAMRHALWASLHALWYEYHPKRIDVVARLESRHRRAESDITIFTQCSLSRLNRLERMCDLWTGVVSAAIINGGGGHVDQHMRRKVSALHRRVESTGKCRLDISLCQPAPGLAARDGLYPVNSLRNAALRASRTDLVLSVDVDAMPMRGLHEVVSRPPVYAQLLEMCRGEMSPTHAAPAFPAASCAGADTEATTLDARPPTFLVVPALEFVGASSPDDPRIRALLQEAGNKREAADLVVAGDLQAFHAACFPEGHRQTNLDRWTTLPVEAAPYEVMYAEGYEPYGFFFRPHAPPFDERFRGFGLDKVSHCWHLHRLGWKFRALPAAYLVDLPHPPTEHRRDHRTAPNFRASVDGLFQRFSTEVDRSLAASPSSLSPSARAPTANVWGATYYQETQLEGIQGRDYEVLEGLSLLAWGDAWAAGRAYQGGGSGGSGLRVTCGGGWKLKGSMGAWEGLRACDARNKDGDELAAEPGSRGAVLSDRDRVAIPPRMVGGWVHVCIEGQQQGDGGAGGDGGSSGLRGRSVIRPRPLHGVVRYWVYPRWDPKKSPRGKLPGLGMSGDVRFFVRWREGSIGFCSLMVLGRPLKEVCEVHVIHQLPFSIEHGRTTAIQLEADMRRTPGNGGALSFRAWTNGSVVYEARVYAGDMAVSGGNEKGMWVEDVLLHVLAASVGDGGDKREGERGGAADAQHVLIGGIEVWGKHPTRRAEEGALEPNTTLLAAQGRKYTREELVVQDDAMARSTMAGKLRFVFVASTGRCGTHYLSQLLGTSPGVEAFHEASPELSGRQNLLAAATDPEKSYGKRRYKAEEILRSARHHLSDSGFGTLTYVETSHLFLKTFSDVVMRELAPHFRVDVVVLRRDPAAVLKSRIELGHFCRRHKRSDWLLLPAHNQSRASAAAAAATSAHDRCRQHADAPCGGDENRRLSPVQEVDMDGFEALIAYAANTETQIRTFRRCYERKSTPPSGNDDDVSRGAKPRGGGPSLTHPAPAAEPPLPSSAVPPPDLSAVQETAACNMVETSLEALQTEQGVRKLFADLDLDVSEGRTWRVFRAGATNARDHQKHRAVPLGYCRQRLINAGGGDGPGERHCEPAASKINDRQGRQIEA
ncbi:unnamed protein product [Ectocarpus sp. 12 AP-2014]